MHIRRTICDPGHAPAAVATGRLRHAFTLVELMVVIVIIGILASLTLAGLSGVRQRAKIEKTKSTIRKIDAVIRPMYESYRTRRLLPAAGFTLLTLRRQLMRYDMPDNWADVPAPPNFQTAATRGYAGNRQMNPAITLNFGSSECLYMIVARSGFEPDAIELFRDNEVGDIDGDGALEFWDAWGRPIAFKRWAPGFVSDTAPPHSSIDAELIRKLTAENAWPRRWSGVQFADPDGSHDPMDPRREDPSAYALVPLIYSAGPDESLNDPADDTSDGYALMAVAVDSNALCQPDLTGNLNGTPKPGGGTRDNITNHDLLKK